jgi:hypothetical protein
MAIDVRQGTPSGGAPFRGVAIAPELAQNRSASIRRGGSHISPGRLPDGLRQVFRAPLKTGIRNNRPITSEEYPFHGPVLGLRLSVSFQILGGA